VDLDPSGDPVAPDALSARDRRRREPGRRWHRRPRPLLEILVDVISLLDGNESIRARLRKLMTTVTSIVCFAATGMSAGRRCDVNVSV
jgi:hypothetical protein